MARSVYVAAGGGGDAIAAYALHAARQREPRPVIATFAWDRLMIDPIPGPRATHDFEHLTVIDSLNPTINPATRPRPPFGSLLPRLSDELDATLVLLDPTGGAVGLHEQLRSLVHTIDADRIDIVDVGGDILAGGQERELRSPLADSLTLAACAHQTVPADVHVVGAGLDGELPATAVLDYLRRLGGSRSHRFTTDQVTTIMPVLDWHPSEATALAAAAARGLRGTVEIRGQGQVVELVNSSADVFTVNHAAVLDHSTTATAVAPSTSFDAAERAVRFVCGRSELDHERRKAQRRASHRTPAPGLDELVSMVIRYQADAERRGIDYVTFRRLAELADLTADDGAMLRAQLIMLQPERYTAPLWAVRAFT